MEILVRFDQINNLNADSAIPILVDKTCTETTQFRELISILNSSGRELIPLEKGKRYQIKSLYHFSCPNIIPPDFINEKAINPEDVLYDISSLKFLQLNLLSHSSKRSFPKRIFISRNNASGRRTFNESDVIGVLKKYGVETVNPENYSIQDQIALFNNAEFIAGGSGAALTNLLFCGPLCKVVVFSKYILPFSGFSTIAGYVGAEMLYITEDLSNIENMDNIHGPFLINTEKLNTIISEWL
jgi:hypothetical protein